MGSCWKDVASFGVRLCLRGLKGVALASVTCAFALCGALVGSMTGAIKGQTTETGLSRGAVIGAVAGAVVSMEVLESCLQGELLSKVAIFGSLVNGKIFREWVSPAVLKAYQWQINAVETSHGETSDIFDISRNKGLLPEIINKLPDFKIAYGETRDSCGEATSCAVCLQEFSLNRLRRLDALNKITTEREREREREREDKKFRINCLLSDDVWIEGIDSTDFKEGQSARRMPACGHVFHVICIDRWLLRHGSCPMCRQDVHYVS